MNKGQVTQDFTLAIIIMLLFVTLTLAVENEVLPKIWEKQKAEHKRIVNIYRCLAIDSQTIFKTYNIPASKPTNGTCLFDKEIISGKTQARPEDIKDWHFG